MSSYVDLRIFYPHFRAMLILRRFYTDFMRILRVFYLPYTMTFDDTRFSSVPENHLNRGLAVPAKDRVEISVTPAFWQTDVRWYARAQTRSKCWAKTKS